MPPFAYQVCNPKAKGQNAQPIVFGTGMTYRTRSNGHLFALESYAGCPLEQGVVSQVGAYASDLHAAAVKATNGTGHSGGLFHLRWWQGSVGVGYL